MSKKKKTSVSSEAEAPVSENSTENIINEDELKSIFEFEPEDNSPQEEPAEEKPSEEKPAEEKPAEEKPAEEKPAEEKPAEEKPAEEKPAVEKPAEEKPAEEKPAEEKASESSASKRGQLTESQLDSLDALDRDLARAKKNKEQIQREEDEKRRKEKEREAEYLAKAKKAQEQAARREERSREIEKQKQRQEMEEKPVVQEVRPVKRERDPMLGMNIIKGLTVLVVVLGVAYAGGLIYMRNLNDGYIKDMEKDLMGISAAGEADDAEYSDANSADELSAEEKRAQDLSLYLPDTDKDGLSDYYEINVSKTDPNNADSDGDKISDGEEVRAGLDPLTADDDSQPVTITVSTEGASAEITGKPQNASAVLDKVSNNSISGATGIVGSAYEFYTAYPMQSCTLTISYTNDAVGRWHASPAGLSVFRFDSEALTFEPLESTVDPVVCTVSAEIDSIGIYAVGVSEYMQQEYNNRIFFLIDNSGSMYPEALCPNSEENDVNFKRLDFANGVIDRLGDTSEYGAAKFTGTYSKLTSVTSDREAVKTQIDSIRTADLYFDGTEIAGSISAAVDELGNNSSDKNYIILLTDGYPSTSDPDKEAAALKKAVDNNITIFTIGLGKRVDQDYLSNIAAATNGQYYQAANASALDRICDKIESFMSYNQTTIDLNEPTDVYILADSGFNVDKDSMAYNNFRADFSETGTDYGIAELTRRYYTGELKLTAEEYTTDSGETIPGYDLSGIEQLADGKPDLVDLKIDFLDTYNKYLAVENKWNYRASDGGLLKYNSDTMDFILNNRMDIIQLPYTVKLPELESWIETLQTITFQKLPEFSSYECAVISSPLYDGEDKTLLDAFRYMQKLHLSSEKCTVYDFGYDGEAAMNALRTELEKGNPVVLSAGGYALNAVRLLRESENTNKLVLEAYDCNNLGTTTYISILRTPVYDGEAEPYYQYSASVYGKEMPLKVYVANI
ncbi:MAG: VWA domain-containing protein [Oscillospiraceae bacterium]|nr:VWA domain-containing protein [Oscillospiraceae bacterium]